jgi:hypothetical protein
MPVGRFKWLRCQTFGSEWRHTTVLKGFYLCIGQKTPTLKRRPLIAYHRGFDGRVAQIEGLEGLSINSTVAELRKTVNTGQIPLTSGSPTICNALNYMCNLYKVDFCGDEIASDGQ